MMARQVVREKEECFQGGLKGPSVSARRVAIVIGITQANLICCTTPHSMESSSEASDASQDSPEPSRS